MKILATLIIFKLVHYSIIMDSYEAFDNLGAFSSMLVEKGFSIIAVGNKTYSIT